MSNIDVKYGDLVKKVLNEGKRKPNRTGVDCYAIPGGCIEYDMSNGFPLLTTKKIPTKTMKVELEGFLKGVTSKKWYQERGCNIWDDWCNPRKVPYGHDDATKQAMKEEDDLGPIYGAQWRNFCVPTGDDERGVDQLRNILETLETDSSNRRMLCSAWNPTALGFMALPPCHVLWQVFVIDGELNLSWYQRSVDVPLGLPFNIASYALLLHLLAKHTGLVEGKLLGFLGDVHIYENQVSAVEDQVEREPFTPPTVSTSPKQGFDLLSWKHGDTKFPNYNHESKISIPLAV